MILPGLDQAQAQPVAERIRRGRGEDRSGRGRRRRTLRHDQRRDRGLPGRRTIEGRPRQGGRRPALPRQAVASCDRPEAGRPRRRLSGRPQRDGGRADGPARPDRAARDDRPACGGPRRDAARLPVPRRSAGGRARDAARDRDPERLHRLPAAARRRGGRDRLGDGTSARRGRLRRPADARPEPARRAGRLGRRHPARLRRARSWASSGWRRATWT